MKCYTFLFHCQSLIRVSKGSKIKRGKFQKEKTERTMKYRIMNMNNPNPTITAMNNEYYDLQYIKAIPIGDYLHACGIEPAKLYNGYALYHAPYREAPNASLKVDFRQNLWHDYGTSQGGSIIDLVMLMRGCSAYEAMAHLADKELSNKSVSLPSFIVQHLPIRAILHQIQGTSSPSVKNCPRI